MSRSARPTAARGDETPDAAPNAARPPTTEVPPAGDSATATYYIYTTRSRQSAIVDDIARVPAGLRGAARRIELPANTEETTKIPHRETEEANAEPRPPGAAGHDPRFPHPWLVVPGILATLCVLFFRRGRRVMLKLALGGAIASALSTGYLYWIRRQLSSQGVDVSPTGALEQARKTADLLQRELEERHLQLDRLE